MLVTNTTNLRYRIAKKTKGLRAKPMVTLIVDRGVMAKFLVDTLEAREPVSPDAMFCIGESNDAWQQSAKKLLSKYTVDAIDTDGWMVCNPKPENSVEFCEMVCAVGVEGYIQAQWGEKYGEFEHIQRYHDGDFVCRSRDDPSDVWVVARKIFINTYTEIGG